MAGVFIFSNFEKKQILKVEFYQDFKLGILGGGQLGRMLIQAAVDINLYVCTLDPDKEAPCAKIAHEFVVGDPTDYDTVYNFGKDKDLITIEIENVNADALQALANEGKTIFPQPSCIKTIQDKRLQKQFYRNNAIPTADFELINGIEELSKYPHLFPAFQKLGKSGYDGRGVQQLNSVADLSKAMDGPSLREKQVDFEKEISVIVARNSKGEKAHFPVTEMIFHPVHNLVEYLMAPAQITEAQEKEAVEIAEKVIESLGMVGLLAVEMFLTKDGQILVNEAAPRPHNSGHQTIEANFTSQYEQLLRAILGLPLGSTKQLKPAAMLNLLGAEGYSGLAKYEGLNDVLGIEGVHIHLYGKKITKPFRKMGHITILYDEITGLKQKADIIKEKFRVIA